MFFFFFFLPTRATLCAWGEPLVGSFEKRTLNHMRRKAPAWRAVPRHGWGGPPVGSAIPVSFLGSLVTTFQCLPPKEKTQRTRCQNPSKNK